MPEGSFWYRLAYDWSPPRHPIFWQLLNFICLIWSALLVIQIKVLTGGNNTFMDQLERTQWYIVWAIGTCLIWSFEVGLTLFYTYHHDTAVTTTIDEDGNVVTQPAPSRWSLIWKNGETWFELILAVFFVATSVAMLRRWRQADQDVAEEYTDALISTIAYMYQVWKMHRDSQIINDESEIDLETGNEPLTEPAVDEAQLKENNGNNVASENGQHYGTVV